MSRLGKKPIAIPKGVDVKFEKGRLTVNGPLGELSRDFKDDIFISVKDDAVILEPNKAKKIRRERGVNALWGTYASHIRNMVSGVVKGFSKTLIIEGIGYRALKEDSNLVLNIGFSHPVKISTPPGLDVKIEKNTIITISGMDKERVGAFAAQLRELKKPEPYKGKGIRYQGEIIRRKSGKKAASTAT